MGSGVLSSAIKSSPQSLVGAIFVASLALYCYRITEPSVAYFDEHYFVPTARGLLNGEGLGEITHPPLGKLITLFFIWLCGDAPSSWRIGSAICGALSVTYVFRLTQLLSGQLFASLLAAILFLCDGLAFTQARIGLLNAPALMLSLAALFTAYEGRSKIWASQNKDAAEVSTRASSIRILFTHYALAGALFGLALSTKWSAAALLPILIGSLFIRPHRAASSSYFNRATLAAIVALLSCTIAFYLLPFIAIKPLFGTFWGGFMKYNELAFKHHTIDAITPFRYSSPWWSWPLLLRPIWYGFERLSDGSGMIRGILCIGNPVVFLAILAAILSSMTAAGVSLLARRPQLCSQGSLLMLVCYLVNWLPWAFATRMTMFHYLYPAIPFGCILSALTLSQISSKRIRYSLMTILLLSAIGMFAIWYPLLSALPISEELWKMLMWNRGWV